MIERPDELTMAPDGKPMEQQPDWRTHFPIDVPQDHFVARREFTKFLGFTSLAFAIGQCWILLQTWLDRGRSRPERHEVAHVDELPVGGCKPFKYPEEHDDCLLLHVEPGRFVAYNQKCTHLSCAVIPDPAHQCLACPCHHGQFDVATGRPIAGPPRRPLPRIDLVIEDGIIYAQDVEYRTV